MNNHDIKQRQNTNNIDVHQQNNTLTVDPSILRRDVGTTLARLKYEKRLLEAEAAKEWTKEDRTVPVISENRKKSLILDINAVPQSRKQSVAPNGELPPLEYRRKSGPPSTAAAYRRFSYASRISDYSATHPPEQISDNPSSRTNDVTNQTDNSITITPISGPRRMSTGVEATQQDARRRSMLENTKTSNRYDKSMKVGVEKSDAPSTDKTQELQGVLYDRRHIYDVYDRNTEDNAASDKVRKPISSYENDATMLENIAINHNVNKAIEESAGKTDTHLTHTIPELEKVLYDRRHPLRPDIHTVGKNGANKPRQLISEARSPVTDATQLEEKSRSMFEYSKRNHRYDNVNTDNVGKWTLGVAPSTHEKPDFQEVLYKPPVRPDIKSSGNYDASTFRKSVNIDKQVQQNSSVNPVKDKRNSENMLTIDYMPKGATNKTSDKLAVNHFRPDEHSDITAHEKSATRRPTNMAIIDEQANTNEKPRNRKKSVTESGEAMTPLGILNTRYLRLSPAKIQELEERLASQTSDTDNSRAKGGNGNFTKTKDLTNKARDIPADPFGNSQRHSTAQEYANKLRKVKVDLHKDLAENKDYISKNTTEMNDEVQKEQVERKEHTKHDFQFDDTDEDSSRTNQYRVTRTAAGVHKTLIRSVGFHDSDRQEQDDKKNSRRKNKRQVYIEEEATHGVDEHTVEEAKRTHVPKSIKEVVSIDKHRQIPTETVEYVHDVAYGNDRRSSLSLKMERDLIKRIKETINEFTDSTGEFSKHKQDHYNTAYKPHSSHLYSSNTYNAGTKITTPDTVRRKIKETITYDIHNNKTKGRGTFDQGLTTMSDRSYGSNRGSTSLQPVNETTDELVNESDQHKSTRNNRHNSFVGSGQLRKEQFENRLVKPPGEKTVFGVENSDEKDVHARNRTTWDDQRFAGLYSLLQPPKKYDGSDADIIKRVTFEHQKHNRPCRIDTVCKVDTEKCPEVPCLVRDDMYSVCRACP